MIGATVSTPDWAAKFDGNNNIEGSGKWADANEWPTNGVAGGEQATTWYLTPREKGFKIVEGAPNQMPWIALSNNWPKTAFTMVVYADISAMDAPPAGKAAVIFALGNKSNHIALVQVAQNKVALKRTNETAGTASNELKRGVHRFALTYDNATFKLYIDNDSTPLSLDSAEANLPDGFQIGSVFTGVQASTEVIAVNAMIDEFRAYNKTMSASEIAALPASYNGDLVTSVSLSSAIADLPEALLPEDTVSLYGGMADGPVSLTIDCKKTIPNLFIAPSSNLAFVKGEGDFGLNVKNARVFGDLAVADGAASFTDVNIAAGKKLSVADKPTGTVTFGDSTATIELTGTEPLTEIPYLATSGTRVISCPVDVVGRVNVGTRSTTAATQTLTLNQPLTITAGSDSTPQRQMFTIGAGQENIATVNQNADITVNKGAQAVHNHGGEDSTVILSHWRANVTYNLNGGCFDNHLGITQIAHDGGVTFNIGGAQRSAVHKTYGLAISPGKGRAMVVSLKPNGRLEVGAGGVTMADTEASNAERSVSMKLAGGTLAFMENQPAPTVKSGINVTETSVLESRASNEIDLTKLAIAVEPGKKLQVASGVFRANAEGFGFTDNSTATLTMPAGKEGTEQEKMLIPETATLKLQLSSMQLADGYVAKVQDAGLSRVTLLDMNNAPVGSNGKYTPAEKPTWQGNAWTVEPNAGDFVKVVFTDGTEDVENCQLDVTVGSIEVSGAGTLSLGANIRELPLLRVEAGANATLTVAAGEELSVDELQLNGNLNVEASAPLCLTRACAGSGTLSWNKGELRIPNSTIAQSDIAEVNRAYKYDGDIIVNGGQIKWGMNTGGISAEREYKLAKSLTLNAGAELLIHVWTNNSTSTDGTGKVRFETPIIFAGGSAKTEDGSYFFNGNWTVQKAASMFEQCWDKHVLVRNIDGSENFLWKNNINNSANEARATLQYAETYSGQLTFSRSGSGSGVTTFRLDSDKVLPKAHLAFSDLESSVKNKIKFAFGGDRNIGALSGFGVGALDIVAGKTLVITGYPHEVGAYSGNLPASVCVNANAELILNGRQYSNTSKTEVNGTLKLLAPEDGMNFNRRLSGNGIVVAGLNTVTFGEANGNFSGGITVENGTTLKAESGHAQPFGTGEIAINGTLEYAGNAGATASINGNLSGSGALKVSSGTLTLQGLNGEYRGPVTVAADAILKCAGTGDYHSVPFGKGTIVNNGAVCVQAVGNALPTLLPISGTGSLAIETDTNVAGLIETTGTLTVKSNKTLFMAHPRNGNNAEDFADQTPSINGPSIVLESGAKIAKSNVIQPSSTEMAATVTVAKGKMLTSSATSTIEVPLSLTATSILDTSAGALTANTVTLPVDGTVTVKANVDAAVLTVTDESSRAAANGTIVACDPAAEGKKFCLSAEGSNLKMKEVVAAMLPKPQGAQETDAYSEAASKALIDAIGGKLPTSITGVTGCDAVSKQPKVLTVADINNVLNLFTNVAQANGDAVNVSYEFGVKGLRIRTVDNLDYIIVAARVEGGTMNAPAAFGDGTTVKVVVGGTVHDAVECDAEGNEITAQHPAPAVEQDATGTTKYFRILKSDVLGADTVAPEAPVAGEGPLAPPASKTTTITVKAVKRSPEPASAQ